MRERCELFYQDPGRSPGRKRILELFGAPENAFGGIKFGVFALQKAPQF